jgi:hypothetical protein
MYGFKFNYYSTIFKHYLYLMYSSYNYFIYYYLKLESFKLKYFFNINIMFS